MRFLRFATTVASAALVSSTFAGAAPAMRTKAPARGALTAAKTADAKPSYGPQPSWVHDEAVAAEDPRRKDDPFEFLLSSSQEYLSGSGIENYVEYVVKPLLKAELDEAVIAKEAANWHRLADILDRRLSTSKWLTGEEPTIADIAVAAPMHVHKLQRLPLDDHPNLKRWMADIEQLPCWQKTQVAVDRALQSS